MDELPPWRLNWCGIDREAAGEAFRQHRADLLIAAIDTLILANCLYSKRIISHETLEHAELLTLTSSKRNVHLFDAIEARIRTNPDDFLTLLDVLDSDPQLHVFAERIWNSYCVKVCLCRVYIGLLQRLDMQSLQ